MERVCTSLQEKSRLLFIRTAGCNYFYVSIFSYSAYTTRSNVGGPAAAIIRHFMTFICLLISIDAKSEVINTLSQLVMGCLTLHRLQDAVEVQAL